MDCKKCENWKIIIKSEHDGISANPYECQNFKPRKHKIDRIKHKLDRIIEDFLGAELKGKQSQWIERECLKEFAHKMRYESIKWGLNNPIPEDYMASTADWLKRNGHKDWIMEE